MKLIDEIDKNNKLQRDIIDKKENELLRILQNQYLIKPIEFIEINRGTAEIYKVTTEKDEYILKIFSQGRTKESILKEVSIIEFLERKEIKVPKYIKTKNGEYYTKYNNQYVILQEFIDGYTMENNICEYNQVIESATILGKLTNALKEYQGLEDEGIIEKWFSKESIEKGLVKIKELNQNLKNNNEYSSKIRQDLDFKEKLSTELLNDFKFDVINKMTILNSHGDYSVQQLIYNDNKETTIIDFETAKKLPIVWEVVRSYSYIDKDAKNGEFNINTLVDYFNEFSKYVVLNKYDIVYAIDIYLIQLVSSVFGYKQYNDNSEKQELLEFAFFRTKLCAYLYKNKNKITKSLIENVKYI